MSKELWWKKMTKLELFWPVCCLCVFFCFFCEMACVDSKGPPRFVRWLEPEYRIVTAIWVKNLYLEWLKIFFPTCQVRVVRFYVRCPDHPSPPPLPRTSTASSRSQWASPDLICQFCLAVVVAGPHLRALDRSGRRRTSTGESRSAVGLAGAQPAKLEALWTSPDLNRRDSARCGPRRTSTGPQQPETKPYRMPKKMPDRISEDMPDRMSEDMPPRMSEDMPDRMSEDMPDRMSADLPTPDRMPDRMSENIPDRMSEDMSDRMPEDMPDGISNRMPDRMPTDLPNRMSDGMNWMPWWGSLETKWFWFVRWKLVSSKVWQHSRLWLAASGIHNTLLSMGLGCSNHWSRCSGVLAAISRSYSRNGTASLYHSRCLRMA